MASVSVDFSFLQYDIRNVATKINSFVNVSKMCDRATTFVVSEVKQNPEKLLTVRYEQARLATHIQALVAEFKDLDRRLMSSNCRSLDYNKLMSGYHGFAGLNNVLRDGECELREINVYLSYLNDILACADK
uniref:BLOC-1-related complex subunit 7 n=1 Tax=Panagrellus redivivus TaxID=6233 RepID=A0A7E4VWX1_PANRE